MSLSDSIFGILKRIKGDVSKRETNTRALPALTAKEKLAAIFAEIDETVLPRSLTFRIADQTGLAMDIGGRRLLRIVRIEPDSLGGSDDVVFAVRDEARLKRQIDGISELLGAFVKVDGSLVVTSGEPGAVYSAKEIGFSEQELREACDRLDLSDHGSPASSASGSDREKPDEPGEIPPRAEDKPASGPGGAVIGTAQAEPVSKAAVADAKAGPVRAEPAAESGKKAAPPEPGKVIQAFLDANTSFCTGIAVISPDGKLKSATGARNENPDWEKIATDIGADVSSWVAATGGFAGARQLIILKSPGLGSQSLGYLHLEGHIIAVNFRNADLARVLSSVSRIMNWADAP